MSQSSLIVWIDLEYMEHCMKMYSLWEHIILDLSLRQQEYIEKSFWDKGVPRKRHKSKQIFVDLDLKKTNHANAVHIILYLLAV